MNWKIITAAVIVAVTVALIVYDVVADTQGGVSATISRVLLGTAQKYPILAFALGVLFGHLFWPQPLQPEKTDAPANQAAVSQEGRQSQL